MTIGDFFTMMGVYTAITGFIFWLLKRHIDKKEAKRDKRDQNIENFMILMINNNRATNTLARATAVAVQRIPDAKCNGDMTAALEKADEIQRKEKEFITARGIEHIFEN